MCAILLGALQHQVLITAVIVKASSGPRYVVSCRPTLPKHKVRDVPPEAAAVC